MDVIYGDLPDTVGMQPHIYPLIGINGPYDDFNAVAPPPPMKMDAVIVFSSNEASYGKRFSLDMQGCN